MSPLLEPTAALEPIADFLPLNGTDYVEFYVGNARQAAYFYRAAFGFRLSAYRGPENGTRDTASYVLEQGKIRLIFSSPLRADGAVAKHIERHGDGVRDIALWVDDAEQAWRATTARGAVSVREPAVSQDEHGRVRTAAIATYGDTIHSFVDRREYRGAFLPGFQAYRPEDVRLLSPLPNPRSLRDFYAFEAHVKKGFEKRGEAMPAEWYQMPVYYKSGHHAIIGSGEDVRWPSFTKRFDYELELAAVIGRQGRNVAASDAKSYIAGYMVMNDFSARDIQKREMAVRLGPAKGKDWCTALGPYLVTPDEVGDVYSLTMTARVNGELWSEGNSGPIHFTFEQMIEFLTQDDTVYPGDVIGSGTVGTGCGLESSTAGCSAAT